MPVEESACQVNRADASNDRIWPIHASEEKRRQKADELLECIDVHAEGALKVFVARNRRSFDSMLSPGPADQDAEKEELKNGEYRNNVGNPPTG